METAPLLRSPSQVSRGLAGPRLGCSMGVLTGLKGHSLSFPALHSDAGDITRVTWRSRGTHTAEAKPRKKLFAMDYLPGLRGQLLLHPTNLRLEISPLKLGDSGRHKAGVDTFSHPTNPKTFSYFLRVRGESKDGGRRGAASACPCGGQGLPLRELPEPTRPMASPP